MSRWLRSDGEDPKLLVSGRKLANIIWIPCGDNSSVELERSGDYERVDRVLRTKPGLGEETAGTLGNRARQVADGDASVCEESVDGNVETRSTTDFSEHRGRHADECSPFVGDSKDGVGPFGKYGSLGRTRQRMDCFRVKNQRFGQARRALPREAVGTGPWIESSSARNEPSCSRSSS